MEENKPKLAPKKEPKKKVDGVYDLSLHQTIFFNSTEVMRVPGGWIYTNYNSEGEVLTSTFTPYSEEFKPKKVKLATDISYCTNFLLGLGWIRHAGNSFTRGVAPASYAQITFTSHDVTTFEMHGRSLIVTEPVTEKLLNSFNDTVENGWQDESI